MIILIKSQVSSNPRWWNHILLPLWLPFWVSTLTLGGSWPNLIYAGNGSNNCYGMYLLGSTWTPDYSLLDSNHWWRILNEACSDYSVLFGLTFWLIFLYVSKYYDIDVLPQNGKKGYQILCWRCQFENITIFPYFVKTSKRVNYERSDSKNVF